MSNIIQVNRGPDASGVPTLNAGEFGFTTDTYELYIGDGATNHPIVMGNVADSYVAIGTGTGIEGTNQLQFTSGTFPKLVIAPVTDSAGVSTINMYTNLDVSAYANIIDLYRSRGTKENPTSLSSPDGIASLRFRGYTGSSYDDAIASISVSMFDASTTNMTIASGGFQMMLNSGGLTLGAGAFAYANKIETTVGNPGLDTTLVTEKGIRDAINASVTNDIDYINAASFNTSDGVVTLSGVGNAGATVDIDGRYLLDTTDTFTGTLSINSSAIPLVLTKTTGGSWQKAFQVLAPNMVAGDELQFVFGKEISDGNLVEFSYHHIADGSTSNYLSIGHHSSADRLLVYRNGLVAAQGALSAATFKMTTGATNNYYLKSDASGNATWAALPADSNTWRPVVAGGNSLGSAETLTFVSGTNVSITESAGSVTINSTDQYTGTVTGSGAADQVAVWSGTSSLEGSASLIFDGTQLKVNKITDTVGGAYISFANSGDDINIISGGTSPQGFIITETLLMQGDFTHNFVVTPTYVGIGADEIFSGIAHILVSDGSTGFGLDTKWIPKASFISDLDLDTTTNYDLRYLKLDASNDPMTATLDFNLNLGISFGDTTSIVGNTLTINYNTINWHVFKHDGTTTIMMTPTGFNPGTTDIISLGIDTKKFNQGFFSGTVAGADATLDGEFVTLGQSDAKYLMLDGTNSPITGDVEITSGKAIKWAPDTYIKGTSVILYLSSDGPFTNFYNSGALTAILGSGGFKPGTTNLFDIGTDSARWKQGFFTGTVAGADGALADEFITKSQLDSTGTASVAATQVAFGNATGTGVEGDAGFTWNSAITVLSITGKISNIIPESDTYAFHVTDELGINFRMNSTEDATLFDLSSNSFTWADSGISGSVLAINASDFYVGSVDVWGIASSLPYMTLHAEESIKIGDLEGANNETYLEVDSTGGGVRVYGGKFVLAASFLQDAAATDEIIRTTTGGELVSSSIAELAGDIGFTGHTHTHASTTGKTANDHHNQIHDLVSSNHTVSGLTTGHVLTALSATTFGFSAATSGTVTGSGATDRVALWNGTSDLNSSSKLTFNESDLKVDANIRLVTSQQRLEFVNTSNYFTHDDNAIPIGAMKINTTGNFSLTANSGGTIKFSVGGSLTIEGELDVYPTAKGTTNLGIPGNIWSNIYGDKVYITDGGNISGASGVIDVEGNSEVRLSIGKDAVNMHIHSTILYLTPTLDVAVKSSIGDSSSEWDYGYIRTIHTSNIYVSDHFYDKGNSDGDSGDVLTSTGDAVEWKSLSSLGVEDNYADSLAFDTGTGVLTLGRTGSLVDLTKNLDGRYSLDTHVHKKIIENPDYSGTTTGNNAAIPIGVSFIYDATAGPDGSWGNTLTLKGSNARVAQITVEDNDDVIAFRQADYTDGASWLPWKEIWHEGNDGTGSGLDADKLDGHHWSEVVGSNYWTLNGTDLYYNGGNVGVGIDTTPGYLLTVDGGTSAGQLFLRGTTPTMYYRGYRTSGSGFTFSLIDASFQNDVATATLVKMGVLGANNTGGTPTMTYFFIGDNYNDTSLRVYADKSVRLDDLAGSGDMMVVTDNNGELGMQAIPTGTGSMGDWKLRAEWLTYDESTDPTGITVSDGDTILLSGSNGLYTARTSGNIDVVHLTGAGYKHIPAGGSADQILVYSASGTAVWTDPATAGLWTQGSGVISPTTSTNNILIADTKALQFEDSYWYLGKNVYTTAITGEIVTSNALQMRLYSHADQGFQIINTDSTAKILFEVRGNAGQAASSTEPLARVHDSAGGSLGVGAHHATTEVPQVVNVCYGTSATPPTTGAQPRVVEGTIYIQYA